MYPIPTSIPILQLYEKLSCRGFDKNYIIIFKERRDFSLSSLPPHFTETEIKEK